MKQFGVGFGLVRRIGLDVLMGLFIFLVLAFSLALDQTGQTVSFRHLPTLVSGAYAGEMDLKRVSGESSGARYGVPSAGKVNGQKTNAHPGVDMAFARTDQVTALILLGLIFSAVFAFNLAFYRHLRAVYAPSKGYRGRRS